MSQKPTIECSPNGPYLIEGLENLRNSRGESIATKTVIALCRCGGSANKPFCDGTHAKIGFSGERLANSRYKRDNYVGQKINIHDNRGICAHAGHCTENLGSVFKLGSEPWIDPDGARMEEVIETVRKCPSGALSYTVENVEYRDENREPMVTVTRDGPYAIVGGIELIDHPQGQGASTEHYTLCRCGGSKNKPFCDGTHWHIKFSDANN
ncbi:MAG: CDGSH iron-sulfur domain-containing protein [Deltaproteobacteria bacterium]|nr:CDGSH iron-sulfur domain-containing protein [Deltaproteobacteria bacterium]